MYNLAPLQTDEGDDPRVFYVDGTRNWRYGYSPCRSFSIGPSDGQCTGDNVAVCAWDKDGEGPGNYMLIGSQSNFSCVKDEKSSEPQLEYVSTKIRGSKVKIRLECNHSLDTVEDAEFVVRQDEKDPLVFTFSHKCACPDGCLEETPSSSPPPSSPPSSSTATVIIGVLGSLLAVALCVFAVVLFRKRCTDDIERRRLMGQNGPIGRENLTYQSNDQSRHLADEENNSSQHQIDSFIKNPIGGKRSQSPSNNIRELKKDNVNILNALS